MLSARKIYCSSVWIAGFLCLVFVSACEAPRQATAPAGAPVTAAKDAGKQPAAVSDHRQEALQEEPGVAEIRTVDSLKLELDPESAVLPKPRGFGAAPDSRWLDGGSTPAELNADENALLPDLFDDREQQKPLDIKGRMLIDEDTNDISKPLDGAEVSIEIKTR